VDPLTIEATPGEFQLVPARSAVVVVDMQNDFASDGGMFDLAGIPIGEIQSILPSVQRVIAAARDAGLRIVYLKMEFDEELENAGAIDSPNRIKHAPLNVGGTIEAPDGSAGRVLVTGTWNTRIVDGIEPGPEDLVVSKQRFSGFYRTELDDLLRGAEIDTLVFTGATTSVCVESTLRDAFYRDYRCLLLSDCTAEPIGSGSTPSNHEATLLVVETLFGWVTDSGALLSALGR
jgi:ureidoacrylate peracid hydrolase